MKNKDIPLDNKTAKRDHPLPKKITWSKADQPIVLIAFDNTITQLDNEIVRIYHEIEKPTQILDLEKRRVPSLAKNYHKKIYEILTRIKDEEGLFLRLPAHPGATQAIREMRSLGIDVRIIFTEMEEKKIEKIRERIKWLTTELGSMDWEDRFIAVKDKTLLRGDYLIDCDPAPENSGDLAPLWEHI